MCIPVLILPLDDVMLNMVYKNCFTVINDKIADYVVDELKNELIFCLARVNNSQSMIQRNDQWFVLLEFSHVFL